MKMEVELFIYFALTRVPGYLESVLAEFSFTCKQSALVYKSNTFPLPFRNFCFLGSFLTAGPVPSLSQEHLNSLPSLLSFAELTQMGPA